MTLKDEVPMRAPAAPTLTTMSSVGGDIAAKKVVAAQLAADTAAFLEAGGEIEEIAWSQEEAMMRGKLALRKYKGSFNPASAEYKKYVAELIEANNK